MYSIYADETCIYDDACTMDDIVVSDPKLNIEDSNAGSLTFTLPPSNIGYSLIKRLITKIIVKKNGDEYWEGRVISERTDFWNNRHIVCEGELAYLNDSTQPPAEYHDLTVRSFLEKLLTIHNQKVSEDKRFTVGVVTVTDPNNSLYRYTNYEKTIECINEKLIDKLGGHLVIRKVNGVRYLDYLKDYTETSDQIIEFGTNLLDFTKSFDMEDFATVILPTGARLDDSPYTALDAYLTVESVNDGSIYVKSDSAVAEYGWIEKRVSWDDVTVASNLLTKAQNYLSELQFDNMVIELSAIDLNYLNPSIDNLELLDNIRVYSIPHGMDRMFPLKKMSIPLDKPENTIYTLGDIVKVSLTSVNNSINESIKQSIEGLPKAHTLLDEAKRTATSLINTATTGYITIEKDENGSQTLYISDKQDYRTATRLWKWNLNGLGYSNDGGETYGTAITMDGSIVADYITAGLMLADRIRGGTLAVGGTGTGVDGEIVGYDTKDNILFQLNKNGAVFNGTLEANTLAGGAGKQLDDATKAAQRTADDAASAASSAASAASSAQSAADSAQRTADDAASAASSAASAASSAQQTANNAASAAASAQSAADSASSAASSASSAAASAARAASNAQGTANTAKATADNAWDTLSKQGTPAWVYKSVVGGWVLMANAYE